jgi:predicted Zn-dependent peptidase
LKVAADVLFDVFFNASYPEAEVAKEGNVICEEIKMYRDNPQAHVFDRVKDALYERPFGMNIAGTEELVKGMTREQLYAKHRSIYVPKNSILCVVGNNEFDEVVSLAERYVVEREGEAPLVPEVRNKTKKGSEIRADIHQANLAIGFHFPKSGGEKEYASEIFSTILGRGMSSRLFREVREKRGLVYGVKSHLDVGKNYGYMVIWAGADPGNVKKVEEICLKEFKGMDNVTEKELEAAKVQLIGNRHVDSESSSDVAVSLIMEEMSGKAEDYYKYAEKINAVTLDEVRALSKKNDYSFFSLGP